MWSTIVFYTQIWKKHPLEADRIEKVVHILLPTKSDQAENSDRGRDENKNWHYRHEQRDEVPKIVPWLQANFLEIYSDGMLQNCEGNFVSQPTNDHRRRPDDHQAPTPHIRHPFHTAV